MLINKKEGLSLKTLKYIAIIAMLIDHIAIGFIDNESTLFIIMDLIGRMTGPIMLFAAVEGYHHTSNLKKYLKRLFIFALVSYLPFIYAFSIYFNPLDLNVIFTIFLGIVAIHLRRTCKNEVLKIFSLLFIIIISTFADYGYIGILMMLVMDYYYGNLKNQLFGYLILVLTEIGVLHLITRPIIGFMNSGIFDLTDFRVDFSDFGYLIPFALLLLYNGKPGKKTTASKWAFYIFYPAHLAIIGLIRYILLTM